MGRVKRVQVRLSVRMETALGLLSEQRELSEATVAYELLRQALDRTINSAECQRRISKRMIELNRADWLSEQELAAQEMRTCQATAAGASVN